MRTSRVGIFALARHFLTWEHVSDINQAPLVKIVKSMFLVAHPEDLTLSQLPFSLHHHYQNFLKQVWVKRCCHQGIHMEHVYSK